MNLKTNLDLLLSDVGRQLRILRIKRGEKLFAVASNLGITHPVISKIENGSYKSLKLSLLLRLISYYNTSLEEIFHSVFLESKDRPEEAETDHDADPGHVSSGSVLSYTVEK